MKSTLSRFLPARAIALAALVLASAIVAPHTTRAQSASEIVVRLNQLEETVRSLSGQVEQLQFENRRLRDELIRLQGGVVPAPTPAPGVPQPRSDVFDPTREPAAPGAPQPLGTTTPSAPLGTGEAPTPEPGGRPLDIAAILSGQQPIPSVDPRAAPSIAATGTGDPLVDYETAYAYLLQRQYEAAEMGFRQYLQSHPRDALVPDATFWLGETYAQRGRHREAAEQFLSVATEFETSPKAPDAMLRLGTSLIELGAPEQACATFSELLSKYDATSAALREAVARERRRAACG